MSGAPAPWKRKLKPLPLPGDTASDATPPSAAGAAAANQPTDGDDELDKLSAMYEAEAVAKARDVASKQAASRQPSQKGMHQLRREGLAAALPEDNKCAAHDGSTCSLTSGRSELSMDVCRCMVTPLRLHVAGCVM